MLVDWPRALGGPEAHGVLKLSPEDFCVDEEFSVDFSDDGEFDWLWVAKRGNNTDYVARRIAELAGVSVKAVTYSGMKDRQALTRQWFCVHLPGKHGRDWGGVMETSEGAEGSDSSWWRVERFGRHRQKLRLGSHRANRFSLTLREVDGDTAALDRRLQELAKGLPNYFGDQRFGHDGGNIDACLQWFDQGGKVPRFQKGLYLSAARAYIFNSVLARRVADGSWCEPLTGELFSLRDSGSVFQAEVDDEIRQRMAEGDIHPSGPLFGAEGRNGVTADVAAFEAQVFAEHRVLCDGLKRHGLKMERRSLRVIPKGLDWQHLPERSLRVEFSLPRGCFATALVREFIDA